MKFLLSRLSIRFKTLVLVLEYCSIRSGGRSSWCSEVLWWALSYLSLQRFIIKQLLSKYSLQVRVYFIRPFCLAILKIKGCGAGPVLCREISPAESLDNLRKSFTATPEPQQPGDPVSKSSRVLSSKKQRNRDTAISSEHGLSHSSNHANTVPEFQPAQLSRQDMHSSMVDSARTFLSLGILKSLCEACESLGYTTSTPH